MYDNTPVLHLPKTPTVNIYAIIQGKRRVAQQGQVTFDCVNIKCFAHDQKLVPLLLSLSFPKGLIVLDKDRGPQMLHHLNPRHQARVEDIFRMGGTFQAF